MATFTAVFDALYPDSSFASGEGTALLQLIGFYFIDGSLTAYHSH